MKKVFETGFYLSFGLALAMPALAPRNANAQELPIYDPRLSYVLDTDYMDNLKAKGKVHAALEVPGQAAKGALACVLGVVPVALTGVIDTVPVAHALGSFAEWSFNDGVGQRMHDQPGLESLKGVFGEIGGLVVDIIPTVMYLGTLGQHGSFLPGTRATYQNTVDVAKQVYSEDSICSESFSKSGAAIDKLSGRLDRSIAAENKIFADLSVYDGSSSSKKSYSDPTPANPTPAELADHLDRAGQAAR